MMPLNNLSAKLQAWESRAPRTEYLAAGVFLFCLIAQGLGVKLAERTTYHQETRCQDSYHYFTPMARSLWRQGVPLQRTGEFCTFQPPGFPLVLAPALAAADKLGLREKTAAQFINVLFGALAAAGAFLFARKILAWPLAILAGVGFGLYPPFVWLCRDAYNEPLFTALLIFGLLAITAGHEARQTRWLAAGMILLGMATLTRAVGILAPAMALAGCLLGGYKEVWRARNSWLLGWVLYFSVLAPWSAAVSFHAGRFVLVTTSFNYGHVDGLINVPGIPFAKRARTYFQENPRTDQAIRFFHRRELAQFPKEYLLFWLRKIPHSWYITESGSGQKPLLLINLPLLALALAGAISRWKRLGRFGAAEWTLLTMIAYFWGMSTLVWSTLRYMVPVMWIIILFATLGMQSIFLAISHKSAPKDAALAIS